MKALPGWRLANGPWFDRNCNTKKKHNKNQNQLTIQVFSSSEEIKQKTNLSIDTIRNNPLGLSQPSVIRTVELGETPETIKRITN